MPAAVICVMIKALHFALPVLLTMLLSAGSTATPHPPTTRITIEDGSWLLNGNPTHPGSPAEDLLMNVRMINTVYEDRGPAAEHLPAGFDPDANTTAFLEVLPEYVAAGVLGFTVGLQGGYPGYEGAVNTAFRPDGSLCHNYLERVARVIEACDRLGAVVILSCLYQRQHSHPESLAGRTALFAAIAHTAAWIRGRGYTNVLLEVANEYAHGGFGHWPDGDWLRTPAAQVALIEHARSRHPDLLVSTSGMGDGRIDARIAAAADFLLIHFNTTAIEAIPGRVAAARAAGKPVLANEDHKVGADGAAAAVAAVAAGAGWGYMNAPVNQNVPFSYEGPADDPGVYHAFAELTRPGGSSDLAGTPPASLTVTVVEPKDGALLPAGTPFTIRAEIRHAGPAPLQVELFSNTRSLGIRSEPPWSWEYPDPDPGAHLLFVRATTRDEHPVESPIVDITVVERKR
ncbi:MAG: hypothetical protein EA425_13155 [Puniceicoccaceae bacterium]|nr:MAG: hypothetical protein EA425_13155 [Puniceicoccaceae bacterium]